MPPKRSLTNLNEEVPERNSLSSTPQSTSTVTLSQEYRRELVDEVVRAVLAATQQTAISQSPAATTSQPALPLQSTAQDTPETKISCMMRVILAFMLLWYCVARGKYTGTTKGLKRIVLGRCFEYLDRYGSLGLLDKEPGLEEREAFCQEALKHFLGAFASKDPCTLTEQNYEKFLKFTGEVPIKDKILFWSKHEALSRSISNDGKRAIVLRDTLSGFLTTDLAWCGEAPGIPNPNPDGINFKACPVCSPKKEPFEVYWGAASASFAKRAKGIVHHLVNGAVGTVPPNVAYHDKTFFYLHELPNIPKDQVTEFRLIVANEPEKTVHETCGTGTIQKLENEIKTRLGKAPVCVVNPAMVMHIMCADKPNAPECVKPIANTNGKHY